MVYFFQKMITGMFQFHFACPTIFEIAFCWRLAPPSLNSAEDLRALASDLRLPRFRIILCYSEVHWFSGRSAVDLFSLILWRSFKNLFLVFYLIKIDRFENHKSRYAGGQYAPKLKSCSAD